MSGTTVAVRRSFSSRTARLKKGFFAASCMTPSEYITPQSPSPLVGLACPSGLFVAPLLTWKQMPTPPQGNLKTSPAAPPSEDYCTYPWSSHTLPLVLERP